MLRLSPSAGRKAFLLGATALAAGLASSHAFAQGAPSAAIQGPSASSACGTGPGQTPCAPTTPAPVPSAPTETVTVTGTRIAGNAANSANPVTIITAKQIQETSSQTLEDVLQKDVSFGSSGLYGTTNNGGDGISCTDIRNLGITRVLVLVDGQRFPSDPNGDCVDLNNIPLQMVDHIDVLKDGASSTYGADAVSGVINVVLKKNFTGTTWTLDGELPTRRGGSTGEVSATTGANFDKGNITIGLDYLTRGAISQADRNYANRIASDAIGDKSTASSGFVPGGQVIGLFDSNDQLAHANGTYTPFTDADRFNFAPYQDLQGSLEKESLSALGHYDINEYMTAYLESFFTHKFTSEQLAPEPIYAAGGSAVLPPYLVVPFGAPGNTSPLPGSSIDQNLIVLQRGLQLGPREYQQTTNTFESTAGIKGVLPYDVTYDTYYTYGVSDATIQTKNSANVYNYEKLLGYDYNLNSSFGGLNGTFNPSLCPSNIGCQNFANLSKAADNYIRYTQTDTANYNLRTYGGDIQKKDVFALPYGDLGLAFGFDHREEHGAYNPDNLVQTGETNEAPSQPTAGGFSVNEVYGEARIPILADLPFAKELTADLGGRYFSYNTFGSGETWKAGLDYRPTSDLLIHGDIGTSFRQPNVNELYGGQTVSAASASDPCLIQAGSSAPYYTTYSASQQAIAAANCKLDKVPAGATQLGNSQINTLVGGNPNLQPETARNENLRAVFKPHWVPNSALTVTFWRTKINNSIGALGSQTILDTCYQSVNESSPLCADLGPGDSPGPNAGSKARDALSQLTQLQAIDENLGVTKTQGIDFGATYNFPIGNFGAISESNDASWVFNYWEQNVPGGKFTDYNGTLYDGLNGNGFPRVRDNNVITWLNGPWNVAYTARFISGMHFENNNDPTVDRVTKTAYVVYHDIEATYNYSAGTVVTVGVQNILDQPAPFVPDGTTNTAPAIYDIVGRVVYVKASVHF
jgi:outer membrane receptor protein involved in Fe transport